MVYKGCPRCSGDLYEEEYLGGKDLVCLQCGYRQEAVAGAAQGGIRIRADLRRWRAA